MTADSYDWISNELFWAGEAILPSLRPPGLPLVIAGLWKLGLLSYLPVVRFLFLGLSTALLYLLLRERHDSWIAVVAAWFFFANDYVLDLAKYVMAETYATPFLVLAAVAFMRAGRDLRWYPVMGAALGIGFLFSYAAVPAGFGLAAAVLADRAGDVRRGQLWIGLLATSAFASAWLAFLRDIAAFIRTRPPTIVVPLLRLAPEPDVLPLLGRRSSRPSAPMLYAFGGSRLLISDPSSRRYRIAVFFLVAALVTFLMF